jgi:hypothetical protein
VKHIIKKICRFKQNRPYYGFGVLQVFESLAHAAAAGGASAFDSSAAEPIHCFDVLVYADVASTAVLADADCDSRLCCFESSLPAWFKLVIV